jgi:hypothetical protein
MKTTDARRSWQIRQPSEPRILSREEIERDYPAREVSKDSRLTTAHRGPCDKGPDQVYIYGLADPRDHVIRYVGKTCGGLGHRLDWHIREPTNRGMAEWLGGLWLCGVRPEIAVLEVCHCAKWEASERSWIARLRKVSSLLNVEDGGDSRKDGKISLAKLVRTCHGGKRGPNE